MRTTVLTLAALCHLCLLPQAGNATLSADAIISRAQQQLIVPAEFVLGEMKVYRQDRLHRSYSFIMGRLWDEGAQTEYVRIDFKTAIDTAVHSDHRYLLKRAAQAPASQWFYLPALRRVRIVPYQPDDPLLQSDYLFYDLTAIQNCNDYVYRFIDDNAQTPVIEGTPREKSFSVPYERVILRLEKRGETYLLTEIQGSRRGTEKHARFSEFTETAPGYYRPQKLTVSGGEGARTEFTFHDWTVSRPAPQLLTPTHLETQALTIPATFQ
jgi:hypothetical protein